MIGTIRTEEKAVIVGAKESGKTSLITSLYSNLQKCGSRSDFDLGDWEVSRFISDETDDPHVFDFQGACNRLKGCRYPLQTKDWSVIKMEVHLSKVTKPGVWNMCQEFFCRQKKIVSLEILDLPGERMSDLALMVDEKFKQATFRMWSLRVESVYKSIEKPENSQWSSYNAYLNEVKWILEDLKKEEKCIGEMFVEETAKAKNRIIEAYKKFLPLIRDSRVVYYAPSTIRLTEDGKLVPAASAKKFHCALSAGLKETDDGKLMPLLPEDKSAMADNIRHVCIGLPEDEFAPLPREAFEDDKYKELRKSFEGSYNKYYKQIVEPIVKRIDGASKVYYLVDVLNLLRDGREKKDAEVRFAERFFKVLGNRPSNVPYIADVIDWFSSLFSSVKKVFLVATQADKAVICKYKSTDDGNVQKRMAHDNVINMQKLMESLAMDKIRNAMGDDVAVQSFVCAAITSTKSTEDGRLVAYWKNDMKSAPVATEPGQPPPVPRVWPDLDTQWEPSETFKYERPKRCLHSVDPAAVQPCGYRKKSARYLSGSIYGDKHGERRDTRREWKHLHANRTRRTSKESWRCVQ